MSPGSSRHPSLDELSAWADGEISGDVERQVLEEHVASCTSCASLVADFRSLAAAHASEPVPPLPSRLEKRVREALARDGRPARRGARWFALPLGAAATILVGVVALWLWRERPGPAEPVLFPSRDAAGTAEAVPLPLPPLPPPPPSASQMPASEEEKRVPPPVPASPPPREDAALMKEKVEGEVPAIPEGIEGGVPGGVLGGVLGGSRQRVAMQPTTHQWVRLPAAKAEERDEEAYAGARRESAVMAPSPWAAESGAADAAAPDREACPALDRLDPPLRIPGLDAARAQEVAERAREAGATATTLEEGPRLTLLVPVRAWPAVREALASSGIAPADAAAHAPHDAVCLLLVIEPAP